MSGVVMVLQVIGVVLIVVTGWMFGRMRAPINLVTSVFAAFGVVSVYSAAEWAFIEGRSDVIFGDPRAGNPALVLLIALLEPASIWVPLLVIPWTTMKARAWAVVYVFATAIQASIHYYFPFDLVVISKELIMPFAPAYLFAMAACLPIAAVGWLLGWSKAHAELEDKPVNIDY